jgi:hypothetical protein
MPDICHTGAARRNLATHKPRPAQNNPGPACWADVIDIRTRRPVLEAAGDVGRPVRHQGVPLDQN